MQDLHQLVKHVCIAPLLVVPVNCGIGWKVSGQIIPITATLELIEDAINDLPMTPVLRSCAFLFGQDLAQVRFEQLLFGIAEVTGVRHR